MSAPLITPEIWKAVVADHDAYWDQLRQELRLYRLAYEIRYWDRQANATGTTAGATSIGLLLIETSRLYEFVEGYQASLFSKEPAVVVKGDLRGRGRAPVVQAACNQFLQGARPTIEDTSRLANLYPCAFVKLAATASEDHYRRVLAASVPGWDVVVDDAARTWNDQRYVGHRYWVPLHEAKERWGNKDYRAVPRVDYLDRTDPARGTPRKAARPLNLDGLHAYIQVVEVYDLLADRLLIWSPDYKGGMAWLDDGKEVEIEGVKRKIDQIPYRTADDAPVVPIAPLYYSRQPHAPLRGIAPARRIYDQVQELNVSRTFQANGVRKAARQWIARKGVFDEDSLSKLVQGTDGEIVEVDPGPGGKLEDTLLPVPHTPTPPEVEAYVQQVQSDLDRGTVLAPFTRGEATKASATEVTALASYSASEIGRLARERDALIEDVARIYTAILRLFVEDGGRDLLLLDGKVSVVKPEDFAGDYTYYAQDGGATPLSEAARKSDLLSAVPLLEGLGVPKDVILKEVVRTLNLPESFLPDETRVTPSPAQMPPGSADLPGGPTAPAGVVPDPQAITGAALGLAPGGQPSPQRVGLVLPNGGGI